LSRPPATAGSTRSNTTAIALIYVDDGQGRAFTRNGYDWTPQYGPLVGACLKLACKSALLDGEVVVEDENGVSDFDALHYAIRHHPQRLVFFAFDLLRLDGADLRSRPLVERRAKLASLNRAGLFRHPVQRALRRRSVDSTEYLLLSKRTVQVFDTDAGTVWKPSKPPGYLTRLPRSCSKTSQIVRSGCSTWRCALA
jgi:hypothetical protein